MPKESEEERVENSQSKSFTNRSKNQIIQTPRIQGEIWIKRHFGNIPTHTHTHTLPDLSLVALE